MPWDRRRYPADWETFRARILDRAGAQFGDVIHRNDDFIATGTLPTQVILICGRNWRIQNVETITIQGLDASYAEHQLY